MNTKTPTLIAVAIAVALTAGSANAGVKDWFKKKTAEKQEPISLVEIKDCEDFQRNVFNGKVPGTEANQVKSERCQYVLTRASGGQASSQPATTMEPVKVEGEREKHGRVDGRRVGKEAAKGCAMGVVMGLLGGGGLDLRSCAAAAIATGIQSVQQQMQEARAVETAAQAAGMKATVQTRQETVDGKQVETFQGVVINYEPQDMARMDDKTRALLDRLAGLADKAKNTLTFTFDGSVAVCTIPLDNLKRRGVLNRHQVVDHCGRNERTHQIVITPVPELD